MKSVMRSLCLALALAACAPAPVVRTTLVPRAGASHPADTLADPRAELARLAEIAADETRLDAARRTATWRALELLDALYLTSPIPPRELLDEATARTFFDVARAFGEPELVWLAAIASPALASSAEGIAEVAEAVRGVPCPRSAFLHFPPRIRAEVRARGLAPDTVPPSLTEVLDSRFSDMAYFHAALLDALARRDAANARALALRVLAVTRRDFLARFVVAATAGDPSRERIDVLVAFASLVSNVASECRSPAAVMHLLDRATTDEAAFVAVRAIDLSLHGIPFASARIAPPPTTEPFDALRAELESGPTSRFRLTATPDAAQTPQGDGPPERASEEGAAIDACEALPDERASALETYIEDTPVTSAVDVALLALAYPDEAARACLQGIAGPAFRSILGELETSGLSEGPLSRTLATYARVRPELFPPFTRALFAAAEARGLSLPDDPRFWRIAGTFDPATWLLVESPDAWEPASASLATGDALLDTLLATVHVVSTEDDLTEIAARLVDVADDSREPRALRALAAAFVLEEGLEGEDVQPMFVRSAARVPVVDAVVVGIVPVCAARNETVPLEDPAATSPAEACFYALRRRYRETEPMPAVCADAFASGSGASLSQNAARIVLYEATRGEYAAPLPQGFIAARYPGFVALFEGIALEERPPEVWSAHAVALGTLGDHAASVRIRLEALRRDAMPPLDHAAFVHADLLAPAMILMEQQALRFGVTTIGAGGLARIRSSEASDEERQFVATLTAEDVELADEALHTLITPPWLLPLSDALALHARSARAPWSLGFLARAAAGARVVPEREGARVARALAGHPLPEDDDEAAELIEPLTAAYHRLGARSQLSRFCRALYRRLPDELDGDAATERCRPFVRELDDLYGDEESY